MNTPLTFKVDVSRIYRNKDGYEVGGYKLNTSFKTEPHTPETFLDSVVKEGWPYTMVFNHERWPAETGAAARGVKTPKHIENFISRQELTVDDDSKEPGVIDFWLHDSFFSAYGFAFVESVNSIPGQAEKGHPTLILDHPINCPKLYKESAKALAWKYPRLDQGIHNIDRTIYNAVGARVHLLGNICPLDVFEAEVLTPYRLHLAEQAAIEEAYRRQRAADLEKARTEGRVKKDAKTIEGYLTRSLDGIFRFVASQAHTRHKVIYWAGQKIGEYKAAEWTEPFERLFDDVDTRIVEAARLNGYLATYAHDNEAEVLRTFNDGRRYGAGNKAPEPELYERKATEARGAEPTPETQPAGPGPKELARLAVRETYLTEAHARREALQSRKQAHYKPGTIPFGIADDEEYQQQVSRVRETFTSAAAWREFVTLNFDELDAEHEYQVKITENKEAKMAFCGKPYKRLTATGEIKAGRILCGLCESCKKLDRLNLRRALESAILADPEQCLMIVTVACKAERARITRRLRESDFADKVLPVASELQADYEVPGRYDILLPSAAAALVGEYEPRELLIAHLNDARLDRWLETPAGERQSGKLIPSRRELREVADPDRFEVPSEAIYFDKTTGVNRINRRMVKRFSQEDSDPEAISLDLPGVVCEGFLPEVAIDHEVHDATELQSALTEIADHQRKILFKRGHVILGVITSKKYYALSDVPTICQLFNERNEALKAKKEARRRKKTE